METKIIFNGKTYSNIEDMSEEERQAYQEALAQFADADKNGIPDIMEQGKRGNVIAIKQSSITFNGREFKSTGEMPAVVRRLFEMAIGPTDANRNGIPDAFETALGVKTLSGEAQTHQPGSGTTVSATISNLSPAREPRINAFKETADTLDILLRSLLGTVGVATLLGATFLMVKMDSGSRSQGGRFYVAIIALVILGAVDSQFRKLGRRRGSSYSIISLAFLLLSIVVLVGAAWYLP